MMAFESLQGLQLVWKQILLGGYAAFAAVRGAVMLIKPRLVLGFVKKTSRWLVEACFKFVGKTIPRIDHKHQVMVVRAMGVSSLLGAGTIVWWLLR